MKYSVVQFSELQRGKRIDADYYLPEFIEVERILQKHNSVPLSSFCFSCKKGIFDISPDNYRDIGVPLIRTSEIKDPLINFSTTVFLEESIHHSFEKTELKSGDLVFTKIGAYIGDVAVLPRKYQYYNFSQNVAGCSIKQKLISSKYILAFLLSKLGRDQILRVAMLSGQGKLELDDIRDIRIPVLGRNFQAQIENVFDKAENFRDLSLSLYGRSESMLLNELGLTDWNPKHQLSFVKKYSDSVNAERFDAEYFQPKYDAVIEAVKNYQGGFSSLGEICKIKDRNFTPKDDENYKYIELANISSNGEISGYMENLGKELPSRARRNVSKGDVVVSSIEGSLESIALITEDWANALCSTGFFVLKSDELNPETLLVFLKTIVGQAQLKRGCKGTILTAVGKDEFEKIVLPKVNQKVQLEIQQSIIQMYKAKNQSKALLEIAKQGAEMAIEKSEEEAMAWLKENLDKIES